MERYNIKNLSRMYAVKRVAWVWKAGAVIYALAVLLFLALTEMSSGLLSLKEVWLSRYGFIFVLFIFTNIHEASLILKLMNRVEEESFFICVAEVLAVAVPDYVPLFLELLLLVVIDDGLIYVCMSGTAAFLIELAIDKRISTFLSKYGKETVQELVGARE